MQADWLAQARDVLYLGRGALYPVALEGALKLKELSYIHAEGYASGELKHGPIALIDGDVPVVVLAPHDALFDKTISNMQEVMARHGQVLLISDAAGIAAAGDGITASLALPTGGGVFQPIPLCRADAVPCLSHGGRQGHRCRSTPQPGKIRHRGMKKARFGGPFLTDGERSRNGADASRAGPSARNGC